MPNLTIVQLEQKIERLQAQLDYLKRIEAIKEKQNQAVKDKEQDVTTVAKKK